MLSSIYFLIGIADETQLIAITDGPWNLSCFIQQKCVSHFNRIQQWGQCGSEDLALSSYLAAHVDKVPSALHVRHFMRLSDPVVDIISIYISFYTDTNGKKKEKKKRKKNTTPILSSAKEISLVNSLLISAKISHSSSRLL